MDVQWKYFQTLFTTEGSETHSIGNLLLQPLSSETKDFLSKPYRVDEVKNAARKLGAWKAPGPDGIHIGFYREHWDLVG